ncbi:hypothetical protein [Schlesneria sp. T3-172]|uniref:hypothetical protein n=1 Tax=Schlesneria sphaerica TaxID=3373610 RepID=UPI0037C847F0
MSDLPRNSVIARPRRWRAVWLSYCTRPLMWGFALVAGLVGAGIAVAVARDPEDVARSRTLNSANPTAAAPDPVVDMTFGKDASRSINWSQVRTLKVMDLSQCAPLWTDGAMPRLESLTVYKGVTDDELTELCQRHRFVSLTLHDTRHLTPAGTRAWQNQTRLDFLRFTSFEQVQANVKLDWPPNLRTLICDDPRGVSLLRLREWRGLHQLETVSTRIVPSTAGVSPEVIDELRQFPRLKRLFLVELPPAFPNVLSELQQALPRIRVRPHAYDPVRLERVNLILVFGFLVYVGLSIQLSPQFVSSHRLLTPRFARSHFSAAGAIVFCTGGLSCLLFHKAGSAYLASVALSGLPIVLLAVLIRFSRWIGGLSGVPVPGVANWVAVQSMALGLSFCLLLTNGNRLELDWFLRGEQVGSAFFLMAATCWGAYDLARWYAGLLRGLEESGGGDVPLSCVDVPGWQGWVRTQASLQSTSAKREQRLYRLVDARMEQFAERIRGRYLVTPLSQWKAAAILTTNGWITNMIVMVVIAKVGEALLMPTEWLSQAPVIDFGCLQLLGSGLLFPLCFAWYRRPMMSLELLRPSSRRDWVLTNFRGLLSDLWPIAAVSGVYGNWLLCTGRFGQWTIPAILSVNAVIVTVLVAVYVIGVWAMTVQSQRVVVLIAVLGWIAVVSGIIAPILFPLDLTTLKPAVILAATFSTFLVSSTVGVGLAYRSWMNWEVGNSSQ